MRLGACVALEAVFGAMALTAAGAGVYFGIGAAEIDPVAAAAPTLVVVPPPEPPPPMPQPEPPPRSPPPVATIFGAPDDELLAPLRDAAITATKLNRGGSSLSLRLDLASGGRAAFKPEQIHPQSNPRREIAAYRVDRLLGIGRVPPAIARRFDTADVVAGFEPRARGYGASRIATEARQRHATIAGELSWWIPEIDNAKLRGHLLDTLDAILVWKPWLQIGRAIPDDASRSLAEQISTLTLFDFLIDNKDRWSGANIKVAPGGDQLFFMDNTMSFSHDTDGHRKSKVYLARVQKYSRRLVDRLRAITEADLREAIAGDLGPFDRLLDDNQIAGFVGRRAYALAHIDRLVAEHGEDAVLAFP